MSGRADYEKRKVLRIERLRSRAESAEREGHASLKHARAVGAIIPLGQPILVGHHSERRHRKDLARIDAGYRRGFKALEMATVLASRARSAERSRAISSDDPGAAGQIRAKIEKLTKEVERMKLANKLIRAAKGDKAKAVASIVEKIGYPASAAAKLLEPDFAGRIGFPAYELTNTGAEIRRLQKRLIALAQSEERAASEDESFGDVVLRENDNRTQLVFPGKPSDEVRSLLKSHGFRWAPSAGAWQRMSSESARYAARMIAKKAAC